jgi:hypothetical protein
MKKSIFFLCLFLAGFSFNTIAGTGTARDEMAFIAAIALILLLLVGLLNGADYIQKNGKSIFRKTKAFMHKFFGWLEGWFSKDEVEYTATDP